MDGTYEDENGTLIYQFSNPETGEKMELPKEDTQKEYILKAGKVIREEPFYERDVWN